MRKLTELEEKTLIVTFKQRFAADILDTVVDRVRGEVTHTIKKESILGVCHSLKSEPEFKMNALSDLIGAESGESCPRFEVIYQLLSMESRMRLRLRVRVKENEEIDSVTKVWRSAGWAEREAYDMFGIVFKGHSDLRRIYLPEDFDGFPLRKDFPLRGYKDKYNPNGEER